jgi:anti-sigma regulatory factor (Ser/Thr protein kinase)
MDSRTTSAAVDLQLALPAEAASVPEARRALARLLKESALPDELSADISLLAGELVTNAIKHGSREGDEIRLRVERRAGCVRIAVDDAARGSSVPQVLSQDVQRAGGRGLGMIDRIADRWGEQIVGGRNEVWFEIELP